MQIEDIIGQKKADISSRALEKSFDSIYNDLSEGVTVKEQVGKFLEANSIIYKKLGYKREELLQKTVNELITQESSRSFAEQGENCIRMDRRQYGLQVFVKMVLTCV